MVLWLKRAGVTLAIVLGALLLWQWLLIVVGAVAVLVVALGLIVAGALIIDEWRKARAVRLFRAVWGSQGRDLLLVYSNSPHWQRYVEEHWLHEFGHRAVILNWSERSKWGHSNRAEAALFRAFAGTREFNPLAIVVPTTGRRAYVVRFWRAFREKKHGNDQLLDAAETEIRHHLSAVAPN